MYMQVYLIAGKSNEHSCTKPEDESLYSGITKERKMRHRFSVILKKSITDLQI